MRLLSRNAEGEFELTSKDGDEIPPYSILSHTWSEGQEVTYDDLVAGTGKEKIGYGKLRFCEERAAQDGLQYFWVDTCCINKGDPIELSVAINSMFHWYQHATKCYVYLSDVQLPAEVNDIQAFRSTWEGAFRFCRWFKRGWTLQELLAPGIVEFFSREGRKLGNKISLEQEIHEVTQIPIAALRSHNFRGFGVEERINWVLKRKTKLAEDKAYCLLGIFGVFLPVNYGEGEEYALSRLRREIVSRAGPLGASDEIKLSSTSTSVSSLLPFSRNKSFVGRDNHFQALEQWLHQPYGHRRMSIYGLGGCGKSALALELIYRILDKRPEYLVFWVPAISRETFELTYREIGSFLRLPGITDDNADVKQLLKNGLSSGKFGEWLMVLDNADDTSVLFTKLGDGPQSNRLIDYLPRSDKGSILFTTRGRKTAESLSKNNILELEDMSRTRAEAKQLMRSQISNKLLLEDNDAIDELLELLTYLPLAIMQATAFINQNGTSIFEYVSLFRDADSEAELFREHFEDPYRYKEMESTIAKTWFISFNQFRNQDQLAADYLSFMACIDRINIPLSLLPVQGSALQRVKAIGTLTGYALITEHRQNLKAQEKFFGVHRLVHMASKWWLQEYEELSVWNKAVVSRLEDMLPWGGHEKRDIWINYLSHAIVVAGPQNCPDKTTRASLLSRIGRCQATLGQYSAAEAVNRQALDLRKEVLGERHPDTLTSMSNLAGVLGSQGKYEEAEAMNRQTLDLRKEVLGERHPDTLNSMNNLALVLRRQGKYEQTEAMNRQTLDLYIEALGERHPDTLISMSNLAGVLGRQGKYEQAEAMNRQTLDLYIEALGERHPDTLISMSNLAGVLGRQGKYEQAEAMNRQALDLRKEVLGERHPDTLTSMSNLASVLRSQGKYEEAEAMNRQE